MSLSAVLICFLSNFSKGILFACYNKTLKSLEKFNREAFYGKEGQDTGP
jgi:hypothetical protein